MAKQKQDWKEHQLVFIEMRKVDPTLTVKSYCSQFDLPLATARRYIKSNISDTGESLEVKPRISSEIKKSNNKSTSDWVMITREYLDQSIKTPALSMREFAEVEGFNYGTLRRSIKKVRTDGELIDLFDQYDHSVAHYKAQIATKGHKRRLNKSKPYIDDVRDRRSAHTSSDQVEEITETSSALRTDRSRSGRFVAGNNAHGSHGGYAQLANIKPDILAAVSTVGATELFDEIQLARAQYLSMLQFTNAAIAKIDEAEASKLPLLDDEKKENYEYERERGRALFGTATRLRELESSIGVLASTIAKMQHDTEKLVQSALKLPLLTPTEQLRNIKEILTRREKEEWTALETARKLEMLGCSIPKTLLMEVQREIEMIEPDVDDSGMTDDELEALTQDYIKEKVVGSASWVARRKARVEAAFARAEADETGDDVPEEFRAGNLFPEYKDDDFDDDYEQIEEDQEEEEQSELDGFDESDFSEFDDFEAV